MNGFRLDSKVESWKKKTLVQFWWWLLLLLLFLLLLVVLLLIVVAVEPVDRCHPLSRHPPWIAIFTVGKSQDVFSFKLVQVRVARCSVCTGLSRISVACPVIPKKFVGTSDCPLFEWPQYINLEKKKKNLYQEVNSTIYFTWFIHCITTLVSLFPKQIILLKFTTFNLDWD